MLVRVTVEMKKKRKCTDMNVEVRTLYIKKGEKAINDYVDGCVPGSCADDMLDATGMVPEFEVDEVDI